MKKKQDVPSLRGGSDSQRQSLPVIEQSLRRSSSIRRSLSQRRKSPFDVEPSVAKALSPIEQMTVDRLAHEEAQQLRNTDKPTPERKNVNNPTIALPSQRPLTSSPSPQSPSPKPSVTGSPLSSPQRISSPGQLKIKTAGSPASESGSQKEAASATHIANGSPGPRKPKSRWVVVDTKTGKPAAPLSPNRSAAATSARLINSRSHLQVPSVNSPRPSSPRENPALTAASKVIGAQKLKTSGPVVSSEFAKSGASGALKESRAVAKQNGGLESTASDPSELTQIEKSVSTQPPSDKAVTAEQEENTAEGALDSEQVPQDIADERPQVTSMEADLDNAKSCQSSAEVALEHDTHKKVQSAIDVESSQNLQSDADTDSIHIQNIGKSGAESEDEQKMDQKSDESDEPTALHNTSEEMTNGAVSVEGEPRLMDEPAPYSLKDSASQSVHEGDLEEGRLNDETESDVPDDVSMQESLSDVASTVTDDEVPVICVAAAESKAEAALLEKTRSKQGLTRVPSLTEPDRSQKLARMQSPSPTPSSASSNDNSIDAPLSSRPIKAPIARPPPPSRVYKSGPYYIPMNDSVVYNATTSPSPINAPLPLSTRGRNYNHSLTVFNNGKIEIPSPPKNNTNAAAAAAAASTTVPKPPTPGLSSQFKELSTVGGPDTPLRRSRRIYENSLDPRPKSPQRICEPRHRQSIPGPPSLKDSSENSSIHTDETAQSTVEHPGFYSAVELQQFLARWQCEGGSTDASSINSGVSDTVVKNCTPKNARKSVQWPKELEY